MNHLLPCGFCKTFKWRILRYITSKSSDIENINVKRECLLAMQTILIHSVRGKMKQEQSKQSSKLAKIMINL